MSSGRRMAGVQTGRRARRSREIRERLIRAAQRVMAEKGVDAARIQEITDAADVGFGSFYNYFESKEAIVEALIKETIESFGDALDRISESLSDPAEVLSASVRYTVARTIEDKTWGWFLIRSGLSMPTFNVSLVRRMARDINTGMEAGRFEVTDSESVVYAASGAVLAIMSAELRGEIGDDAPRRAAEILLRMLGLSPGDAAEVSRRPLPPVDLPTSLGG